MRRQRAPISYGGEQLLRELVESVPAAGPTLRPVALRSVALQRRQALAGYAVRNRLDTLLLYAEWLMGLVLVLVAGGFVLREPIDNWLYPTPPRVARAIATQPAPRPAMPSLPTRAPRTLPSVNAEPAVAEWEILTPRDAVRARHPELGRSLPSSTRPGRDDPDYIAPAQRYARPEPAVLAAVAPIEAPPAPQRDLRPQYLEAPAVGIQADVVEVFLQNGVWQVADYAVGFHHGTGLPGEGNLVMAGHKGIRGAVFANLEALQAGDELFVDTTDQRFRYRVRETRTVWPSQVDVMYPTPTPVLTLLTCTNWDLQRFVVIADFVDSAPRVASTSG